ncbi:glycine cleavage system protein R [Vibrio sp. HN007]|uniref:glycine cleavage system protein R n=1 Tax=Vibrio iocasae TaxID=3098914 RepID=UPI0035D4A1FB
MNSTFIVNFVGKASPSTIKQLAATTHENGGKWLISKVNFIENQVAAVIKIELPSANEETVKAAFRTVPDLLVQFVESDSTSHNKDEIFQLRLDSNDRAGIVNEITQVLDGQDIHILDMDCQRVFIAGGGGISNSLFTANMAIRLPEALNIDDVTKELESLSEDTRVILTNEEAIN